MYFSKLIVSRFCATTQHKHHVKITDLVKRMTNAQETLAAQN
jgi:hypothetical protein